MIALAKLRNGLGTALLFILVICVSCKEALLDAGPLPTKYNVIKIKRGHGEA